MKRPRTQRTRLVAAVAAVALLPVTVLALAGGDGTDAVDAAAASSTTSTTAPTTTTTIAREDLPPEAQELLDLVDRGRSGTFHARYAIFSPGLGESAATAELEVWRDVDRIRQDTVILDAAGPTRTAGFGSSTGTIGCQQAPGGDWTCRQVATEAYDPSEDFMTGILEALGASPVTVQDATVGAFAGRCFTLAGAELCLSPDGVPLRVDAGGTAYEILELDDDVADADFVPPAPVAPA